MFSLNKIKPNYTVPHISFQPENIRSLCQAASKVAYELRLAGTDIYRESIKICTKYSQLFSKFAKCHQMLNGKIEFDDENVEGFSKM